MHDILADGFYWTDEEWGRALRSRPLGELADHFFTSLPLRLRGESGDEERDWKTVAATIGVAPERLLRLTQVHGNHAVVARAGRPAAAAPPPEADIILSNDSGVALAVQVADCVPLLFADRRTGAVAAAHAGWRGTMVDVAAATVRALAWEFGSRPEDLVVAHGPSIGSCCYTVGAELIDEFRCAGHGAALERWFSGDGDGRLRLDLWLANRDELVGAGVPEPQIHQCGLCTASHPGVFASYRRDGKGTGRIAAVVRARR